jgi:bifunctional UDP-N-acetylglucosamine pyrophosphorylase/glucosamine-1-phosphate N-acetyltransferase
MKLIILAAWEWTRLKPITNTKPKPLIKITWKTIIEHNLDNILNKKNSHLFNEIIIVVKYKKEKIIDYFGNSYNHIPIKYHIQSDKTWTAAALIWIDLKDDILIINWDSIFDKNDLDKIINFNWYWVLAKEVEDPSKYGIFETKEDLTINKIIEKPKSFVGNLANLWVYKLNYKIFEYLKKLKKSERWEYELTDAINEFAKFYPLKAIKSKNWFIDIWYSWDILKANKQILSNLEESIIKWTIEKNVNIKWNIILEKWAILKSGTYIEWNCFFGKNSIIWPNIYIRWNTSIWDNCKIWANNEIKNSYIWDNTNIAHLSYIWDSIIWDNVNIWWWFLSANLRHDWANIKVPVKWKLTDTWLRKLWIIIWDNVKTWVNTISMPGRIIENDTFTLPQTNIK